MLAMDVGNNKVCVVEGSCRGQNVTVTSWGEIEYKSEVVANGSIKDRSTLTFLIHEIIKTRGMKSKKAVISMNSSDIIAREFKLPNVKPAMLQQLVRSEMTRIVGNENEFVTDYIIHGFAADKLLAVTAYAVPKEMVASYYTLLRELKLTPLALDIHANTMSKLLANTTLNGGQQGGGNIIIADIGYSKIVFHGYSGGVCRFNRTELSPVQEFTHELASLYRLDVNAEVMAGLNLSPDAEYESPILADTCKYFVSRVADEIQRYTQYIMINSQDKTVTRIYICGGVASVAGITAALSDSLKIAVEPLDRVGKLHLPADCRLTKVCNAAGALIRL